MGLLIELEQLGSRLARVEATGEGDGLRRFALNGSKLSSDSSGNIISQIWDGLSRFGGFIMSAVWKGLSNIVSFSLSGIWSLITTAFSYIMTFDFNASDTSLDKQIQASFNSLAPLAGQLVGQALGWIGCGVLPGVAIFTFNEAMGVHVLEDIGEQALAQLAGTLSVLVSQLTISLTNAGIAFTYKNLRKLWRESDDALKARLDKLGLKSADVEKALAERSRPWTIAGQIQAQIQTIPDEFVRSFAEGVFNSIGNSCIEAGYAVANSVDTFIAMQKQSSNQFFGHEQAVEITLNREEVQTVGT